MTAIKPIIGTQSNDTLIGGRSGEVISGRAGDDWVSANHGHDKVWGGTGNDTLYGNVGNDVLYGGGGPSLLDFTKMIMSHDYSGRIVFESESAGYKNSLGSYKINDANQITDVTMHFPNASLQGSGGSLIGGASESSLILSAGDQLGFFIVANGYSYNDGYNQHDFSSGSLDFRNSDGSNASLSSSNPQLWFTSSSGEQTQLMHHKYHSRSGLNSEDFNLNPDLIDHTVGLLNSNVGEITLGFEDLYNGGDLDFDDTVFTIDIGVNNALGLKPASTNSGTSLPDDDVLYGGSGNDELHGRAGNDIHHGGSGADTIYAGSGDDVAYGGTGSDRIYGGPGEDLLLGESGNDYLSGGNGNDQLFGGNGNDDLLGNTGDDRLHGNSGNDILKGAQGNDTLDGGSGNDSLYGSDGQDFLFGMSGNDYLYGGNGADSINGGSGNDHLYGNRGDDLLSGGHGSDQMHGNGGDDFFISGAGRDHHWGGAGSDTIDYSALTESIRIDLHGKRSTGADSDHYHSIENAIGSSADDWFRGDLRDNNLSGGAGDDYIRGAKGADTLSGGLGSDTFSWRLHDLDKVDQVVDFSLDDDILEFNFSVSSDALSLHISLTESNGSTLLAWDADGDGSDYVSQVFANLNGVTNLSWDALSLA